MAWQIVTHHSARGHTSWHVMPMDDLREHQSDGPCWCCPVEADIADVMVHNSLDGREGFEAGLRKVS